MQRNWKRNLAAPHHDVTAALPHALEACSLKKLHSSAPEKTRSLGMRHFKLFDGNFAFVQPATNLRLFRALQPQFDCFFDHLFRVLRRFTLTDDAEFGAARHIPSILSRLDHGGKFWKFHHQEFTSLYHSSPIVTPMALIRAREVNRRRRLHRSGLKLVRFPRSLASTLVALP